MWSIDTDMCNENYTVFILYKLWNMGHHNFMYKSGYRLQKL